MTLSDLTQCLNKHHHVDETWIFFQKYPAARKVSWTHVHGQVSITKQSRPPSCDIYLPDCQPMACHLPFHAGLCEWDGKYYGQTSKCLAHLVPHHLQPPCYPHLTLFIPTSTHLASLTLYPPVFDCIYIAMTHMMFHPSHRGPLLIGPFTFLFFLSVSTTHLLRTCRPLTHD